MQEMVHFARKTAQTIRKTILKIEHEEGSWSIRYLGIFLAISKVVFDRIWAQEILFDVIRGIQSNVTRFPLKNIPKKTIKLGNSVIHSRMCKILEISDDCITVVHISSNSRPEVRFWRIRLVTDILERKKNMR